MGGGGGQTKPAPENRFATGALTGYILGPQDLGDSKATEGAALFGHAGQGQGILPDWADVQATAGESYFGGLAGDNANPILTDALGRAFSTPEMPNFGGGGGGGFGGGGSFNYTPTGYGPDLVTEADVARAKGYLMDTPSVFDQMSGGPIVDTINQRVQTMSDAYRDRQMSNLDRATEVGSAQLAAQGGGSLISSSQKLDYDNRLKADALKDLAVFDATANLDATKYLGDLAMQDIMNQSNNMQTLLTSALTEKNIDAGYDAQMAATMAQYQAAIATANISAQAQMKVAQLNSWTTLTANTQDNAMNLLNMGLSDFQDTQKNKLGIATLPLTTLGGLAGSGSITNQPKSP